MDYSFIEGLSTEQLNELYDNFLHSEELSAYERCSSVFGYNGSGYYGWYCTGPFSTQKECCSKCSYQNGERNGTCVYESWYYYYNGRSILWQEECKCE